MINIQQVPGSAPTPGGIRGGRLAVELTLAEIIGHAVLWLVISLVTLGIGLFFYPYSLAKTVLNKTVILDENERRVGRLQCELTLSSQLGHIILWLIISVITLGLGYVVYLYKVWTFALQNTRIV